MDRKPIFSKRSSKLSVSPLKEYFKRVKEMERNGKDILSLAYGDFTIDTDSAIKNAAISAINHNKTHYVPETGSYDIKKIIADKYSSLPEEVIISSGAKTVLAGVLWSVIDPGDQVLIPSPYYPSFFEVAKSLGAKVILVDTLADGFFLTAKNLEKVIKNGKIKPKVLILNSPNNPTGVEYPRSEIKKIIKLSAKYGFTIISDECYSNYSSDKDFTLRCLSKNIVSVNSVSKTHAMTGWRIGWAVMPLELAKKVTLYLENYVGCPNSIAERAAIQALPRKGVPDFRSQRKMITSWLSKMGMEAPRTGSGLYIFADFSRYIDGKIMKDSSDLAEYCLARGVAIVPGTAFGPYPKHVRMSYCSDLVYLKKALSRLERILLGLL